MITKPSNWDTLRSQEGTVCTYKLIIGSDVYTSRDDIEDNSLKIKRTLFTSNNLIGNTPCFTLECCLRLAERTIPRGAMVKAQVALKNGDTVTDFIPLGTFKVYRRQKFSDGWVKLTCRDKMQTANQGFFKIDMAEDEWPKPMITVLRTSAAQVGVEIDPRTVINEGDDWVVTPPVGQSIRAVWSAIAAAHAGNFYITPEDKLLLVTPKADGSSKLKLECSEAGCELLGAGVQVDQVTLKINSEAGFSSGESGVNNIEANCPYANQVIADYVKEVLTGVLYYPIKAPDLWIDPAMEAHDSCWVMGSESTLTVWSSLDTSYRLVCSADGFAESMVEPDNEYGFEDTPVNQLRAQSKQFAIDAIKGMTQEEVFNKLTNNGKVKGVYIKDGQLYFNASYIMTGKLTADLISVGILQSKDGTFRVNLDTGEITIASYSTSKETKALADSVASYRSLLEEVSKSKVDKQDIVDDLETDASDQPLSAAQGALLKYYITQLQEKLSILKNTSENRIVIDHSGIPVVDWSSIDLRLNVPLLLPASMHGTTLPSKGEQGQLFFLRGDDGMYSIRVYDGETW